jgi:hypothetical protein
MKSDQASTPKPPEPNDQEGRIRAALKLARGPLPAVGGVWLRNYYEHLAARLSLPFQAEYAEDIRGFRQLVSPVTVVVLLDPDKEPRHEDLGLVCEVLRGTQTLQLPFADLEVEPGTPNFQLIEDYWYWFWNWRFDPQI